MMMMMISFSGAAIKCWECKSHADPRCADPFDNTSLPISECAARKLPHYPNLQATMCRKTRQKGEWTDRGGDGLGQFKRL